MSKMKYEKPYFELISLQYEIFTEESPEYTDDDILGGAFTTVLNMIRETIGFDYDEEGYLIDKDGNRLEVDSNGDYHDKDGNIFRFDEDGHLVDENGNVMAFADEETSNTKTEDDSEKLDDETIEEEVPEESAPSQTDLDYLSSFADQIAEVVGDGSSEDFTTPEDSSTENSGSTPEEPTYEEPISESTSEPDGNYGFDDGTE